MTRFLEIAEQVLDHSHGQALTIREIWERAKEWELIPDEIRGKTPQQTLKSKLSVDIRTNGERSKFARLGKGKFVLRRDLRGRQVYLADPTPLPGDPNEALVTIPKEHLLRFRSFQGIVRSNDDLAAEALRPRDLLIIPRDAAESRNDVKQIIVYVAVVRKGKLLAFMRGSRTRAASFLMGAWCCGFGGHVSSKDAVPSLLDWDSVGARNAAVRELTEEIAFPKTEKAALLADPGALQLLGFINDDSSDNGRRHLAIVYEYNVWDDSYWEQPKPGEQGIRQLRWIDPEDTAIPLNRYEYWSQLLLSLYATFERSATARIVHRAALVRPHVVCVVGPIGSGKSEAASALESELGYRSLNSGLAVASLLGIPPVPETPREEFQVRANEFISKEEGPRLLARELVRNVSASSDFVIDGVRQRRTLRELREALNDLPLCVLFIDTLPEVALEFFRRRERPDIDVGEFFDLRAAAVEREVEDLVREADVVIHNWEGIEAYRSKIISVFKGSDGR